MFTLFAFGLPQGPEILIIFLVVLLLFGASRLPGLARALGKSMGEFRKAKDELDREIQRAANEAESTDSPSSLPDTESQDAEVTDSGQEKEKQKETQA